MLILLPCHMLVTYAGFQFTQNELRGVEKEQLLDGLEEGLIIIDNEDKLLYQNQAVNKFIGNTSAVEERKVKDVAAPF